jgi:microcompartment protein CcmK/EutM
MILGKVVGTVVASQKEPKLTGLKFLVVKKTDLSGTPKNDFVVAVDSVQAGIGDIVLYASGSSARQTAVTDARPVDATIMAIVDTVEVEGKVTYDKSLNV